MVTKLILLLHCLLSATSYYKGFINSYAIECVEAVAAAARLFGCFTLFFWPKAKEFLYQLLKVLGQIDETKTYNPQRTIIKQIAMFFHTCDSIDKYIEEDKEKVVVGREKKKLQDGEQKCFSTALLL